MDFKANCDPPPAHLVKTIAILKFAIRRCEALRLPQDLVTASTEINIIIVGEGANQMTDEPLRKQALGRMEAQETGSLCDKNSCH